MAISRAQLAKELEPGLNALFGMEYDRYENEHSEIYETESSDRAFEEEVMLVGFGNAPTKSEGSGVSFDSANEAYTARYTHETIALAFALTEEAIEDNLYDRLASRYTKALARSMAHTKQVKSAAVLNNAFDSTITGGDGKELCATDHPLTNGNTFRNELSTAADLNETSLENSLRATLNFALRSPDTSSSISLFDLYNFGLTLNTDFFATKNLPSLGSVPANIAGAPSHFTVMLTEDLALPANISLKLLKKFNDALPPSTPKFNI